MVGSDKNKEEQQSIDDRLENKDDSRSVDQISSLLVKGIISNFLGCFFDVLAIYGYNNWESRDDALFPLLIGGCLGVYGVSRIYKAYRQMRKTNP